MINNNFASSSFLQKFQKRIKKLIKSFLKSTNKNKIVMQRIQLSFIYSLAICVLLYSVRNTIGVIPEFIYDLFPPTEFILNISFLKILAAPEKTFFLYLIILEFIINRSLFNFSLLIKYNVLLIFILEMFQNLVITYWDLLYNREMELIGQTAPLAIDRSAMYIFFSFHFLFFLTVYVYSFYRSFLNRFPVFPGKLRGITDSVAFWLQIRPPRNSRE